MMPPPLGETTIRYLDDKAGESFKRQIDLEESIWRSLPLFTGALIAAAAIVASAARALPEFHDLYAVATYGVLALSVSAFLGAFFWLWIVVKPREFDYPPDDAAIAAYAAEMTEFHVQQGLSGAALDEQVMRALRLYMSQTLASASKSTFNNNQTRLSARSQVLAFLLTGFLLAFACDAAIFAHRVLYGPSEEETHSHADPAKPKSNASFGIQRPDPTGPAADAGDQGRGLAHKTEHRAAGTDKVNGGR